MQSEASLRAALIENIKLLNTYVVAMSDELRHWSQDNRRHAVEKWASHELQSPQSSLADPREATESLTATERRSILKALVQTNGNTLKAARVLGIGGTTLYRRLQEYRGKNHSR
jgi:DNA-binding NtrC family response regulator